jgi:excisionase family DNA binding protein
MRAAWPMMRRVPAPLDVHTPEDWPAALSTTQVARLLAVHRDTVLVWCDTGRLPAAKVGTRWRVAAEDVWPLVPPGIRATWTPGPWCNIG